MTATKVQVRHTGNVFHFDSDTGGDVKHRPGGWIVTYHDGNVHGMVDLVDTHGRIIVYRTRLMARVAGKALAAYLRAEYTCWNRAGNDITEKDSYGPDSPEIPG